MERFQVFSSNIDFYDQIKNDLRDAKKSIYFETYIFNEDKIGKEVRDILTQKAQQGLKVKVLLDGIGALRSNELFFFDLIAAGGEVQFFHRLLWSWWLMEKMIMRDHRKLLIIDERITFIGSSNIDQNTLNWLELDVRIDDGNLATKFMVYFEQNFEIANRNFFKQRKITQSIKTDSLEIVEDSPSLIQNPFRHRVFEMLQKAKRSVKIVSPYVIVDKSTVELLRQTAKRGIRITIIVPDMADHQIVDMLNKRCMAIFHKLGIEIRTFRGVGLHAKMLIADNAEFIFGSSNLDYLSFFMLFEINLAGDNPELLQKLLDHYALALKDSKPFDLSTWKNRPFHVKILDWLLYRVRFIF